jgi:hypothetical protein
VIRSREKLGDIPAELEAEILVEQKLDVDTVIRRLSRSVAYARQARM